MTEIHQAVTGQDQEATLAFLGGSVPQCKRIDTHASIVFLGRDRVLKVKRAVRLPFLDYSTLAKRKQACEDELAVNSRFAPELYRRIVPITRRNDFLEIGGDGPVIEWAVEMTRFDESKTFDHLAQAGDIAPELAEALAGTIRRAHLQAAISDGASWLTSIAGIIDCNTHAFRNEAELPGEQVDWLNALSHWRLADCRETMETRVSNGLVRRCHGDAHLGNIVLIDGRPVLFDAIEFDPVIATTDLLYDLVFPIMDFCHFGRTECANRLFNSYLLAAWSDDAEALRLLPLFLSMRAAIRANVLFTKRRLSPDYHDARDARAYFDLALKHIETMKPSLIAIGGKSGTGKSVLACKLAAELTPLPGAVVLRSDVVRKQLFGVEPLVALPAAAYTPEFTATVYQALLERSRQTIQQGFSVIIDAAFLKESEREELSRMAGEMDTEFHPLFLTADLGNRLDRIRSRSNDASDATPDIAAGQEDYEIGRVAWPVVDASGSPEQTLERSRTTIVPR